MSQYFPKIAVPIFLFFLLGNAILLKAQNTSFSVAEKLYQKGDYYSAIPYYSNYLFGKESTTTINTFTGYLSKTNYKKNEAISNPRLLATYHLADCYRLLNDYTNAQIWYDSSISIKGNEKYPVITYWRGICLRANGKIMEAKEAFIHYLTSQPNTPAYIEACKKELANIAFAQEELTIKKRQKSVLKKLSDPINSNESNYAPFIQNQNLYFSSTRPDTSKTTSKVNPFQHHIYATNNTGDGVSTIEKIVFQQDKNVEQGSASFSTDGKTIFITQWEIIGGKKMGAIFKSYKTDSGFTKPLKLDTTINSNGFTSQQPFISADGKYLFFSSNKTGGKGQFDIWCAELGNDFTIKKVFALDDNINTKDNEKAPYFNSKNQTLVFASNGKIGMGGYDLFYSKKSGEVFSNAVNLGSPINSFKDDEYFYAAENSNNLIDDILLSSDRSSNCCLNIFSINRLPVPTNHISGFVKDANTLLPLTNATFYWQNNITKFDVTLTNNGSYTIIAPDSAFYTVKLSLPNYMDTLVKVTHVFNDEDTAFCQDFFLRPITVKNTFIKTDYLVHFEFTTFSLSDSAKTILDSISQLLLTHKNWQLSIEGHTDGKGSNDYNVNLSKNRSNACYNYLKDLQIDASRISISYLGKTQPIAPNTQQNGQDNPEGRQLNRRVQLKIIKGN